MNVGDKVRIVKCDVCPKIVGKTGVITKFYEEGSSIEINFGKGRPQLGRPNAYPLDSVVLVEE